MLRFRNVFYTISKLFHCPAKVFSEQIVHKFAILCCESYTCILILLCLSIFRSGAISGIGYGWVWMGSLCGAIVWASLCDANKAFGGWESRLNPPRDLDLFQQILLAFFWKVLVILRLRVFWERAPEKEPNIFTEDDPKIHPFHRSTFSTTVLNLSLMCYCSILNWR